MSTAELIAAWNDYARSLRLWVLSFIVWLAEITDCRELRLHVRQELRALRHDVRAVLVMHLAIEVDQQRVVPKAHKRPRRAHVRECTISLRRFYRFVLRGIRLRNFADARRVLENLEAYVARCTVNYLQGMALRRARRSAGALAGVQTDGDADVGGGADAPDTS